MITEDDIGILIYFFVDPDTAVQEINKAYGESHRHFHTTTHILNMLDHIWKEITGVADLPRFELELAVIFHDWVYNPQSTTNEEDSVKAMMELLNGGVDKNEIAAMIMATKTHKLTEDPETNLLLEADMEILFRTSTSVLVEYEEQISKEYSFLSPDVYKAGRLDFLSKCIEQYPDNKMGLEFLHNYVSSK